MAGLHLPLVGLCAAFVAFALWVSGVSWRALDAVVLALFAAGASAASVGYARAAPGGARRLAVIAIGVNGFGALLVLLLYGVG
jgi:hypothetical protein